VWRQRLFFWFGEGGGHNEHAAAPRTFVMRASRGDRYRFLTFDDVDVRAVVTFRLLV
jgi:hypothetical protein